MSGGAPREEEGAAEPTRGRGRRGPRGAAVAIAGPSDKGDLPPRPILPTPAAALRASARATKARSEPLRVCAPPPTWAEASSHSPALFPLSSHPARALSADGPRAVASPRAVCSCRRSRGGTARRWRRSPSRRQTGPTRPSRAGREAPPRAVPSSPRRSARPPPAAARSRAGGPTYIRFLSGAAAGAQRRTADASASSRSARLWCNVWSLWGGVAPTRNSGAAL